MTENCFQSSTVAQKLRCPTGGDDLCQYFSRNLHKMNGTPAVGRGGLEQVSVEVNDILIVQHSTIYLTHCLSRHQLLFWSREIETFSWGIIVVIDQSAALHPRHQRPVISAGCLLDRNCVKIAPDLNCLWPSTILQARLVHLDVEDCSEELLRQQSYAIENQLGHPKPPTRAKYPHWGVFCLLLAGSLWHNA